MKKSFARAVGLLLAIVIAGGLAVLAPTAAAQQKFKNSPPDPDAVTKYTQQHVFDVGDMPGHQVRIATLHTKYSDKAGEYDGVKFVESTAWLTSDYVNGSGRFNTYAVTLMANGDKVFSRADGVSQTSIGGDGARKTSYSTVTTITGGTGKFAVIRGTSRASGVTDFKTGVSNTSSEGEYWFDK
ncbi:MAG TPA: hypothetical protein VLJ62_31825 [Burkholderiaceae bacterium]|nr:hypothetical protein [Burkholderiaceae bacterium]